MICEECGAQMTSARESFPYRSGGLPNVLLVNIRVDRCPACGAYEVELPAIQQLHKALAHFMLQKRERLHQDELRFLRKYLGFSLEDLAPYLEVSPEQIAQWEEGTSPILPLQEKFLRALVAIREPVDSYPFQLWREVAQQEPSTLRTHARFDENNHWRAVSAA
jgi:YgiT-type zinc finger domain-containing protein